MWHINGVKRQVLISVTIGDGVCLGGGVCGLYNLIVGFIYYFGCHHLLEKTRGKKRGGWSERVFCYIYHGEKTVDTRHLLSRAVCVLCYDVMNFCFGK